MDLTRRGGVRIADRRLLAWQDRAACRGMPLNRFFPDPGDEPGVEAAKQVCRRCPVIADCRQHAVQGGEHDGVWGGLDGAELARTRRTWLRHVRAAEAAAVVAEEEAAS